MAEDADLSARMDAVVSRGRAEFPDFDASSGYVVAMTADQGALRHALGELGEDAHRVVAHLADDPDEAARVLALRGPKLGAALAKFTTRAAPPRPAPPPKPEPKPVDLYDPSLSAKAFNAELDRRAQEKRAAVRAQGTPS